MFRTPDRVCSRLLELFEWIRNFFGEIHFKKEPLKETEHWREKKWSAFLSQGQQHFLSLLNTIAFY